jgi:hypothetical protein
MKVRIDRTRMAMGADERCYAYDGVVSTKEIDRSQHSYFVIRDGKEYVSFADATRPAELNAMEKGWERYQATLAHETRAKAKLLELAKVAFPELAPATVWPELWVSIPSLDASHETRYAKVKA